MNKFKISEKLKAAFPTILSGVSVAGVVWVAIQSAVDTPKALRRIEKKQEESDRELKWYEKAIAAAPSYIPTAIGVTLTSAAIIASDKMHTDQTSKYALLAAGAYQAYNKLERKMNNEPEDFAGFVKDMAKDTDLLLFWEPHYGYFLATKEQYYSALLKINEDLQEHGGTTVEEFLLSIGLHPRNDQLRACHLVGWSYEYLYESTDRAFIGATLNEGSQLEPDPNGEHVYEIEWEVDPIMDPWNYDFPTIET